MNFEVDGVGAVYLYFIQSVLLHPEVVSSYRKSNTMTKLNELIKNYTKFVTWFDFVKYVTWLEKSHLNSKIICYFFRSG